jgi:DNA-binding SARP family transcriptional activator
MSQASGGAEPAVQFRLCVLGSPSLSTEGGAAVPGMGPGKPLAMLAYLIFQKSVRRDELIALLWGDVVESKARNAFRQTLHRLRTALGEDMLSSERDVVILRGKDRVWCDAIAFQKAVSAGNVQEAVHLYGGRFLEGLELNEEAFVDWLGDQRRRFAAAYENVLARGAQESLEAGDWKVALERAQLLTVSAPHSGDAAVLEATALLAGGRRAEAVTALTVYARRMETDLGSSPSESASSMLQAILSAPTDRVGSSAAIDSSRFRKPQFVGREKELATLLALWRRAAASEGRACVIHGELGMGKSRLVSEFLARAPSISAPLTLHGQERRAAVSMPYASIAEALRPALNAPGLAGASQHLLAEAARLLPELRDQFDLPEPAPLGDDAERVRFYEGIAALVDAVSYEQPVCVVLEDLHHASGSTLELVRYMSRRLRTSPVLIIATWETKDGATAREEVAPVALGRERAVIAREHMLDEFEPIDLTELSLHDSERLMADLLSASDIAPEEIRRLAGLSRGLPLRVTELAERASAGAVAPALPVTVRDVLWRRLQQCSPHEQRLFVAAALFSQAVGIRLLAAAAHVSETAALEGVTGLERRGLLLQREGRLAPASPAAADLALETTGAAGVTLLAGWAADALAAESTATDGELARLYALAERRSSAYRHAMAAALAAAACGAREETERYITLAGASAGSDKERAEIDALALALGHGGQRLLAGTAAAEPAESRGEGAETPPDSTPAVDDGPLRRSDRARRALKAGGWVTVSAGVLLAALLAIQAAVDDRSIARGSALVDTLVLVERLGSREQRYYLATGLLTNEVRPARGLRVPANAPSWLDSLSLPWINPRVSPDGRLVAAERATATGVDLYVIDSESRAATPLAANGGDHIFESWSPDGARLLVVVGRTATDGTYDSDLFAYQLSPRSDPVPIDTAADRSVLAARWSPRGTHVAWVAREGQTRQQEVFVAQADGSRARNVSQHAAEDFDIAWSADGEHIAFTSERDGNAEIYTVEVATGALRRMTFHPAQDSRPAYSPDGQFLGFESARQGQLETFVMPSFAGAPRRLLADNRRLEILEWRGNAPAFVDAVAIRTNVSIAPGDSAIATAEAIDQYGTAIDPGIVRWSSLDPGVVDVRPAPGSPSRVVLVAERQGSARIAVDAAGWRGDTVLVHATPTGTAAVREDFESGGLSRFWTALGSPAPFVRAGVGSGRSRGLVPNGDGQGESGALGAQFLTLRPALSVQLWLTAPFLTYGPLGREVSIALVAPDARTATDSISPQFLKLVSVSWLGDAARLRYAVEREFRTEPVVLVGRGNSHLIRITIEESGRAAFYVDGSLRWRSTVLATPPDGVRRVQLWIGSKATGALAVVDDVEISP